MMQLLWRHPSLVTTVTCEVTHSTYTFGDLYVYSYQCFPTTNVKVCGNTMSIQSQNFETPSVQIKGKRYFIIIISSHYISIFDNLHKMNHKNKLDTEQLYTYCMALQKHISMNHTRN